MKKTLLLVFILSLIINLVLIGCGIKKAESSKEAIQSSKSLETKEEQTSYLVKQAKAFYNSKDFKAAMDITGYIGRYLDKDSKTAKELFYKAKEQLAAAVKKSAEDAKKESK